jgi:hypothetical protein
MNDLSKLIKAANNAYTHEKVMRDERTKDSETADLQKIWDALKQHDVPFGVGYFRNLAGGAPCVPIIDREDTRKFDEYGNDYDGWFRPAVAATLRDGTVWIVAEHLDSNPNDTGFLLPVGRLDGLAVIGQALANGGRADSVARTAADEVEHHLNSVSGDYITPKDDIYLSGCRAVCTALLDVAAAIREQRQSRP